MSKLLLNSTKPNETKINFIKGENSIEFDSNEHISLSCLYTEFDTQHINLEALKLGLSDLIEATAAFDSNVHCFNITKVLNGYELITVLQAIDKSLNDTYTFILNVEDKDEAKTIITNYKSITTNDKVMAKFKELEAKGEIKEISHSISKLVNGFKQDYTGKKLLLIDTHNKYHRDYHALPHNSNSQGVETLVIKKYLQMVMGMTKNPPDYVIFATEGKDGIRKKIYTEYKGNRNPTDDALRFQIAKTDELSQKLGFQVVGFEGYEADDVIASYAIEFAAKGGDVQIVSTDKDLHFLLSDHISIYNPTTKKIIKVQDCIDKFGVEPSEIRLYLSLCGDSSDNIPGVKGIGDKTAAKLIKEYKDIDGLIKAIPEITPAGVQKKLEDGIDNLLLSYSLVELFTYLAVEDSYDFERFAFPQVDLGKIQSDLEELEINMF